jgi:hypothetical protein
MPKQKTIKAKLKPFPADNPCPCGSGSLYRDCCAEKKFRFKIDKHGNVIRQLKIHPRLKPELERALQEFKEMFGRKPGRGDPIWLGQHLTGEDDFWQHSRTIGKVAGLREELTFAWRRSGLIVGEHSRGIMPDSDYDEWQSAIDEYFLLKEDGYDPFFVFTYLSGEEYEKYKRLIELLDHTIIVMGFAHTNPKRLRDSSEYFRYLLIGRAIRSLRTIREMYNTRYDDDCLAIARAVYPINTAGQIKNISKADVVRRLAREKVKDKDILSAIEFSCSAFSILRANRNALLNSHSIFGGEDGEKPQWRRATGEGPIGHASVEADLVDLERVISDICYLGKFVIALVPFLHRRRQKGWQGGVRPKLPDKFPMPALLVQTSEAPDDDADTQTRSTKKGARSTRKVRPNDPQA